MCLSAGGGQKEAEAGLESGQERRPRGQSRDGCGGERAKSSWSPEGQMAKEVEG